MKNKIIQIGIIIGLFFSIQVNAAPVKIKSIELSGLGVIPETTVISYLPINAGDDITNETSTQIIQALFATDFFADIDVLIVGDKISISLIENPHIKYIDILNYSDKVLDSEELDKSIDGFNLSAGSFYTKNKLHDLVESIKSQ